MPEILSGDRIDARRPRAGRAGMTASRAVDCPVEPDLGRSAERRFFLAFGIALVLLAATTVWSRPAPTLPEPASDSVPIEGAALVVVWVDGEVTWRPEERREARPTPLVIGERLGPGLVVEAGASSRAVLLAGGDRLATMTGPGRWLLESDRITSLPQPAERPERVGGALRSPRPQLERLTGYREGSIAVLEPLVSMPLVLDEALPMTLALIQPAAPVLRSATPELRWHWPFEGGRFDLTLEETDASGIEAVRLVERWRNLQSKQLVPYAPLVQGRTYRVTLSLGSTLAGASMGAMGQDLAADSPIVDRRVFHVLAPSEKSAVDGALGSLDTIQQGARRFRPELDVLKARLLETHGLWDEAEAVWTGLAILYPSRDDVLAHALRLHARSVGGRR